ncbi:MAG: TRAP transporter small permease [Spirochaetia bacterium]|nr:TRAP transporter small permease [Spirochaetia bacterium]MCF7940696.1 TRAP transporter small permease [Spirochaetia bacterium]
MGTNDPKRPIDTLADTLTALLEHAVTAAFFVIIIMTILLVVLRYGFNSSIVIGNELMEYLFVYTTALGAAVSLGKREHIKISYVLLKIPQPVRNYVDAFGQVLVAGINLVVTYLSFSWIRTVGHSASPVMRIPMWTVQIAVPIGCTLAALYALVNIYHIFHGQGLKEDQTACPF